MAPAVHIHAGAGGARKDWYEFKIAKLIADQVDELNLRFAIVWLFLTGCRVSEALSAQQSDIKRLENGTYLWIIPDTKTHNPREVVLPDILGQHLDETRERNHPNRTGRCFGGTWAGDSAAPSRPAPTSPPRQSAEPWPAPRSQPASTPRPRRTPPSTATAPTGFAPKAPTNTPSPNCPPKSAPQSESFAAPTCTTPSTKPTATPSDPSAANGVDPSPAATATAASAGRSRPPKEVRGGRESALVFLLE